VAGIWVARVLWVFYDAKSMDRRERRVTVAIGSWSIEEPENLGSGNPGALAGFPAHVPDGLTPELRLPREVNARGKR
jgi:hypothetical protein